MGLGTGIEIPNNFDLNAPLPLDARFIAADETARDLIDPVARFEGLLVYCVAEAIMYQLQGGVTNGHWVVAGGGGGGGGAVNVPSLETLVDGSYESGPGGWTQVSGTATITNPAADLLTATNLKMVKIEMAAATVVRWDFTIPAGLINNMFVLRGRMKKTGTNTHLLTSVLYEGSGTVEVNFDTASTSWQYFEKFFKANDVNMYWSFSSGLGVVDLLLDECTLKPIFSTEQGLYTDGAALRIDFNTQLTEYQTTLSQTYSFENAQVGSTTTLAIRNIGGSPITMTFPTTIKRADASTVVAAGTTSVFTFIRGQYGYYMAVVPGMT